MLTWGEWSGTMCLTDPHCGTDLGLLGTSAEPQPDYPGIGTVYDYVVVDTSNLPPEGEYRVPENDYQTFFKTKWSNEFTNVSGS